jgi:hypothetical protein
MRGEHGVPGLARKSHPPLKDPLAAILLALGFAVLVLDLVPGAGLQPLSIVSGAMLCAGLAGLHRVTNSRAPLFVISGVVALWVLQHFWDVVPIDSYKLLNEHKTIYDTPGFLANVVLVAIFVAIPIVARPRAGSGLMVLALAALAMSVIAKGPLLVTDKDSSATLVLSAIERGWFGVAARAVAIVFFASAFEPKSVSLSGGEASPLGKRGLVIVAVIGAALFTATYDTLPEHVSGASEGYTVLMVASMALAWVLSAIGFAGVARAGGGTGAWVAMALAIVQVPVLLVGLALMDRSQSLRDPLGAVMGFGLLAIGVAGVTAPGVGARAARGFAGILALTALFGTLLTLAGFLGAAMNLVHGARAPGATLHMYAIPIVGHAAVAWAASLAYLVAPPSDRVAA